MTPASRLFLILLALCLFLPAPAATEDKGQPIVFGVHPYLSPSNILERFLPLAEYIERNSTDVEG